MFHLVAGVLLIASGVTVTALSKETVWYGAILVGLIEVGRGVHRLRRTPRPE